MVDREKKIDVDIAIYSLVCVKYRRSQYTYVLSLFVEGLETSEDPGGLLRSYPSSLSYFGTRGCHMRFHTFSRLVASTMLYHRRMYSIYITYKERIARSPSRCRHPKGERARVLRWLRLYQARITLENERRGRAAASATPLPENTPTFKRWKKALGLAISSISRTRV